LYVHIPFCSAICNYCNFNRGLFDNDLKNRYLAALIEEIRAATTGRADTIYFGGGTPSLLTGAEIGAVINACRSAFDVAPDAEITIEANPETVSVQSLTGYREAGANRVSFGVQSFRDDELRRLSRLHGSDRAAAALAEARQAGFDNVSLDLMMWLPGQTVAQWLESVDRATTLDPDHLSLYMLEVYPNAPLKEEMARARWSQAPDDDVADMYTRAMEQLERAGYAQYEISNVAKPQRRSRHNLKYWSDGDWLGFGCGAHSTLNGTRWKNVSSTDDYVARIGERAPIATDIRHLTEHERVGEALFTGLRLSDGLDVRAVNERYGTDVWVQYGQRLEPFVELGLLEVTAGCWKLTRQGMLLAHEVMSVFV